MASKCPAWAPRPTGRYADGNAPGGSALTRLEAPVGLVDHVDAALATDQAVVAVAATKRFQGISDFHAITGSLAPAPATRQRPCRPRVRDFAMADRDREIRRASYALAEAMSTRPTFIRTPARAPGVWRRQEALGEHARGRKRAAGAAPSPIKKLIGPSRQANVRPPSLGAASPPAVLEILSPSCGGMTRHAAAPAPHFRRTPRLRARTREERGRLPRKASRPLRGANARTITPANARWLPSGMPSAVHSRPGSRQSS